MFDFSWYQTLIQPALSPPSWVYTPVWIVLYVLMAISFFIYIKKESITNKIWGYILFTTQLLLNLSWTPTFFGLKNLIFALVIITFLDILVLFTIIEFIKVSKISSMLLIPYFLWVLFATYLNVGFLFLN